MKIKKSTLEVAYIMFIFFCAIFNDVIRVPGTSLSLFRLLLPTIFVIGMMHFRKTYRFFVGTLLLIVPFVLQNIIFCKVMRVEEFFDIKWSLTYVIHYVSIILILILMRVIKSVDEGLLYKMFVYGAPIIGCICIVAFYFAVTESLPIVTLANRNNYACCMAALFPWYLIKFYDGKKWYGLLALFTIGIIWWGDSKAAFMGILVEVGLVTLIKMAEMAKEGNKLVIFLIPVVAIAALSFVLSPITMNGYSIRDIFIGMVSHIVKGELYPLKYISSYFRTNAIIFMIAGIKQSYFIGIGPGNSGKYLKYCMPEMTAERFGNIEALAPHNAWMEFFLDCGLWAIVLSLIVFIYAIRLLFKAKELSEYGKYYVAFAVSFPIWVMSASVIYTIFLLFIVISWLYENRSKFLNCENTEISVNRRNYEQIKKS